MAKDIYNERITRETDWGGDASTGGRPVSGARVQEYIKEEIVNLEEKVDNVPVVDESLDPESTNAVANGPVASALQTMQEGTVNSIEAEVDEDAGLVTIALFNRQGGEIDSCEIPMLGGSGDESSDATKLVLNPTVTNTVVKVGEDVRLSFEYDIVYASGDDKGMSTGIKADLEVTVMCGPTMLYNNLTAGASAGTYTHDIGKYLIAGTCDIYIKAAWTTPDGTTRNKQKYLSVKAVTFNLSTSFSLTAMLAAGGYGNELAEIPYRVSGSGTKIVTLYIDGEENSSHTVTATNPSTQRFLVPMDNLSAGAHSAQIVATLTSGGRTLYSNSLYITLLRSGVNKAVAVILDNPDGNIVTTIPQLPVSAFSPVEIKYGIYDSDSLTTSAQIKEDEVVVSNLILERKEQTYSTRYITSGLHSLEISCGTESLTINVVVSGGDISINEAEYGRKCRLKARGRSNSESVNTRSVWADGDINTTFENVDWASSGWIDDKLHLIGGAKATVNIKPFANDGSTSGVKVDGRTIEMTLRISRVNDYTRPIVSCMEGGKGFRIQGDEIAYLTGETTEYPDEDDPTISHTREVKLSTNYVEGDLIKVTFVIDSMSDRPVMHLYVNGNRCGADKYSTVTSFLQSNPTGLTFDSEAADIDIESIRYYERALSDDEVLANHIADQTDTTRMVELYNENDVLDQEGNVSMAALLARGKGVMLIVRPGLLDDVYATNNKKTDFTASLRYYPPAESGVPGFTCDNCYIRIQGTSSTKYPSKNIRFYLGKGPSGKPVLMVGGEPATKYRMRPGAIPMNLFTAKSDYSDSSMSLNTGGARLFTDVMKELGLLTPPQQWQQEHDEAINVRASIDGVPIDVFAAESDDSAPVYYGQYNFNNEKSKSGPLFGMEDVEGYTPTCPIALESLNNTQPLCLFQAQGNLDTLLAETFDKAFEFNYPEDTFWSQSSISDTSKEHLVNEAQYDAIKGLFSFIKACVPVGADPNDISTFVSQKFAAEAGEHFDVDYLLTYYLWTEFFVSVDQRAKNILWRTWDGQIWYPTYYDGDTQRGKRNDSFMAYGPDTERDTWDVTAAKYAFEGHDSWLWCLCLANLYPRLVTCAANLRAAMDADRALDMLVNKQSGNWSDRVFNRSGELKYITPAVEILYGRIWPFIYALQGADRQHSTWFIRQRWSLMDAKYGIGDYTSDNIECYLSRGASDPATVMSVSGARTYAYGYGTNNAPNLGTTGLVQAGETATISITGAYTMNDPVRIYGASRMHTIDASGMASVLQRGFDISKCSMLEELDLHVPSGKQPSINWYVAGVGQCLLLRKLNLSGQTQVSTESGTRILDLSTNTRLEDLDARGTTVTAVILALGAKVSRLHLPDTLTALRLENLHYLSGNGAVNGEDSSIASLSNITSVILQGCENIDSLALIERWLEEKTTADSGCSLEAEVNWVLDSEELLMAIAQLNSCTLRGTIAIKSAITVNARDTFLAKWPGCLSPGGELHVTTAGIAAHRRADDAALMTVYRQKGWAANEDFLTVDEAAAVTGTVNVSMGGVRDADSLGYFTGITSLHTDGNGTLERITVPENVTSMEMLRDERNVGRIIFLPMECPAVTDSGSNPFRNVGSAVASPVMMIHRGATGYDTKLKKYSAFNRFTTVYID